MRLSGALVAFLSIALSSSALAQKQKKKAPVDDDDTADLPAEEAPAAPAEGEPMPSYDESGEPAGASENPDAPETPWDARPEAEVKATAPAAPTAYPIERIHRPLVLPRRMLEIGLEVPMTIDPGSASGVLRGAFGVTRELQVGLRYAMFTSTSDKTFVGKTFAIDLDYLVFPWLAAQVSLPVTVDPYAQGIVLGAPMKFTFQDKFAIEVLRDLVGFKVYRFLPNPANAAESEGLAILDEMNAVVPDSELNLGARVTYQFAPNLAGDARYNVRMPDFEQTAAPHELTVGAWYSTSNMLDVAARIGFLDLSDASESFTAQLVAAYRL